MVSSDKHPIMKNSNYLLKMSNGVDFHSCVSHIHYYVYICMGALTNNDFSLIFSFQIRVLNIEHWTLNIIFYVMLSPNGEWKDVTNGKQYWQATEHVEISTASCRDQSLQTEMIFQFWRRSTPNQFAPETIRPPNFFIGLFEISGIFQK